MTPEAAGLTPEKIEEFVREFRKIGLYENRVSHFLTPEEDGFGVRYKDVLIIDFHIGDLAFSQRVQAPEQKKVDDEFGGIARQLQKEMGESWMNEIRRRSAEGKGLFD